MFGRRKTAVNYDDRIVLRLDSRLRDNVNAILAFVEVHKGHGHRLVVAHEGTGQTLACSCGMPASIPAAISASLAEEDVNDG